MMIANGVWPILAVAAVLAAGVGGYVYWKARRAARLAPWKLIRNGMSPQEVRNVLGEPRKVAPLEFGEIWDYGAKPYQATVTFTHGKISGFIKPF